jgi:allophanate hydrolase
MDRFAHAAANQAVDSPPGATAIEVSMGGLELVCESGEVTCCVAGGEFQVMHSGRVLPSWCVRILRPGDLLSVRPGPRGSWAYIAFSGELICNPWAGGRSTHAPSGLGGGRLTKGAALVVRNACASSELEGDLTVPEFARARHLVRVVLGPQTEEFDPEATTMLLQEEFIVTPAYDRMGMRLEGPKLALKDALSIPSEPIVRGSVQVGGDGIASILLADHQTTGGYPKVATIVSSDTDAVAQLRPRDRLRFHAVKPDEASRLVRSHARAMRQYLDGSAGLRSRPF